MVAVLAVGVFAPQAATVCNVIMLENNVMLLQSRWKTIHLLRVLQGSLRFTWKFLSDCSGKA